jgi:hypothetical protein
MQSWIVLLVILVVAEILVLPRIPAALVGGAVPLNPLGWFGYGELQQVSVDRKDAPAAYWLIVLTMIAFAAFLALLIWAVVFRGVS